MVFAKEGDHVQFDTETEVQAKLRQMIPSGTSRMAVEKGVPNS